jgi:hypothetical protein
MQVPGPFSPFDGITLLELDADLAPWRINGSASGLIAGAAIAAEFTTVKGVNMSHRLTRMRLSGSAAADLQELLAAQASSISATTGVVLPKSNKTGFMRGLRGSMQSAEVVLDNLYGLRLLNVSLGGVRLSLGDMAGMLGFDWQDVGSPVTFVDPWIYYVPSKPDAPVLQWHGRQFGASAQLGVSAVVDIPSLGITSTFARLLVNAKDGAPSMSLEVSV